MLSRLTGGLRPWELSLEGRLHDTQPPASIAVAAQELGQNGRPLVEPGAFFVDGSYGLRINSWNSLAGVAVTVRMRFLGSDGRVRDNEWTHTPNTNRTKATSDFPLAVGFPLNVTAFASAGAPLVGQTFVQVQIVSGVGGATTLLGTLLQDYVTSVQALAWPGSPIRSSTDITPPARVLLGSAPAAGAEVAETVPTGASWELIAFQTTLTTSATVINRFPRLVLTSGGGNFAELPATSSFGAGATAAMTWAEGVSAAGAIAGNPFLQSLPRAARLPAGAIVQSTTINLQVGDQYTAPRYLVRELLEASV